MTTIVNNPDQDQQDRNAKAFSALWDLKLISREMRANDKFSKDDLLNRIEEVIQAYGIFSID